MTVFVDKIRYWVLAITAAMLMTNSATAEPIEFTGTLDPERQVFGDMIYAVFEVATDQPTVMAVRSDALGLDYITYFQSPLFIQNDFSLDWVSGDLRDRGYQGNVTPEGVVGTWLFFVLADSLQEPTSFDVHFDNAVSVTEIDPSRIDEFDLIAAFDQIGILDEDASRRVSVSLLSNMLESPQLRKRFIGRFSSHLFESSQELEIIGKELEEAERRSDELNRALENSVVLEESQTLVAKTLEAVLRRVQAEIASLKIQGVEALALQEGLQGDLVQLWEIDSFANPSREEAQFLRQSFATKFLENEGEVVVQVVGSHNRELPFIEIYVPTYLPGSGAGILEEPAIEAPVIVEPSYGSGSGNIGTGTMSEWNPDDWNGSAFVRQKDIFRATHRVVVKRDLLEQAATETIGKDSVETLGEASTVLAKVLGGEGFSDLSYQGIENDASGFILATGLDQTDANGVPLEGELRNSIDVVKIKDRSLSGYLRALFTSEPGYFRAILFLVSAEQYTNNGPSADFKTMQIWSDNSLKGRLPDQVSARAYSNKHEITALIYEFRKVTAPEFIDKTRSNLQAQAHFSNTQRIKNHLLR